MKVSLLTTGTVILCFIVNISLLTCNYTEEKLVSKLNLIHKENVNNQTNAIETNNELSDKVFSFEILPKKGNSDTEYSIHLLYNCEAYPLEVKVDLEFFDPLTEKSLFINTDYLKFNLPNCQEKVKLFRLNPLPEWTSKTLKTDYVLLVYYVKVTNSKGMMENLAQKGNEFKIKKNGYDVIPFDIRNNPVRDNKEKLEKYAKMNLVEKKNLLNETIRNLTKEENKDENLQTSILISQYVLSTKCEPSFLLEEYMAQANKEKYNHLLNSVFENFIAEQIESLENSYLILQNNFKINSELVSKILAEDCTNYLTYTLENSMHNLVENFRCETVEKLIFNQTNPNNTIILAALSVLYPSFGNLIFTEDSFKNHFSMSNCLSTIGLSLLNKYNYTEKEHILSLSEDYIRSLFFTASNILDTLSKNIRFSNRTFDDKFSLIINEETQNAKALIEKQENLFVYNQFNNNKTSKVKSDNLIFLYEKVQSGNKFVKENQIDFNSSIKNFNENKANYKNFSLQYEEIDTQIIVSLPVDYILYKFNLKEVFVSAINYKNYPLLKNPNKTYSDDVVSIKIFDATQNKVIDVDHLEEEFPIKIYMKKKQKSLKTCLFYDDELKIWNDFKCKNSAEESSDYIVCDCYHLTDFSFAIINPADIYKDFISIIFDIRFINDIRDFRFANFSNAGVLYMFLSLFLVFLIYLLVLLIKIFNNKKSEKEKEIEPFNDIFLYFYNSDNDNLIIKKLFNKQAMDRNLKIQSKKLNSKIIYESSCFGNKEENKITIQSENEPALNIKLINDDFSSSPPDSMKEKDLTHSEPNNFNYIKSQSIQIIESSNKSLCLKTKNKKGFFCRNLKKFFYSVSIVAFEYRIVSLFSDKPFIMNHFSILFILFFDTINYFSVSSLISPNNSLSGDPKKTAYGYVFIDRKIAIYFIIILLSKIPKILLAKLIKKFPIERNCDENLLEKNKQSVFRKYCSVYVFIILYYIIFLINTFWISMNNVKHKRSNDFIYNFIFSLLIKYVWIFVFILIKSFLLLFYSKFHRNQINLLFVIYLNIYTLIP